MPLDVSRPLLAPVVPDLVWFTGSDALKFLNDLLSQEIADMGDGEVRRSLLLGPQGKLDHILWVIRSGEVVGLVTDPGRGEELATTLGRYRIRVDVEIAVETETTSLIIGEWSTGFDVSWSDAPRHLLVGEPPELSHASHDEVERLRILSGEPEWGKDVDGSTIPHSTGLVPLTVAFDKGCFLGQELVARIDSRGASTPSNLMRLELSGETEVGASIGVGDDEVGVLTSVSGTDGLAMLRRGVESTCTTEV